MYFMFKRMKEFVCNAPNTRIPQVSECTYFKIKDVDGAVLEQKSSKYPIHPVTGPLKLSGKIPDFFVEKFGWLVGWLVVV